MSGLALAATFGLCAAAGEARAWHLGLGYCELEKDPGTPEGREELLFNACLRATAGSEIAFYSGSPKENGWLTYGSGYAGLFVTPWLSVQGRAVTRSVKPLGEEALELHDRHADFAVVQLGNPVLHRFRLTAGHTRLPFGVDQSEAPEFYKLAENRKLWASPEHAAYVTIDNLRSARFDVGVATSKQLDEDDPETPAVDEHDPEKAASIRAMYDVSALEGTRIVASGYGAEKGERRYGISLINMNRKEDYTAIEWVRRLATPDAKTEPFQQLIRLAYMAAWRGSSRWVVQIDDERFRFRRGIASHEVQIAKRHAVLKVAVSYTKSESGDNLRRWAFITGLEAKL